MNVQGFVVNGNLSFTHSVFEIIAIGIVLLGESRYGR
jgi:hypothetical protein